jgi:hypothetical protein
MKPFLALLVSLQPLLALSQGNVHYMGSLQVGLDIDRELVSYTALWSRVKCLASIHTSLDSKFRHPLLNCETGYISETGPSLVLSQATAGSVGSLACRMERISQEGEKSYRVEIQLRFNSPGAYIVKETVEGIGSEDGVHHMRQSYWAVTVLDPILLASLNWDTTYYYGETKSFSFATLGYDNLDAYSHKVFIADGAGGKGKEIGFSRGPYVTLDPILNNVAYVGDRFVVEGYYKDKVFEYVSTQNPDVKMKTIWTFRLLSPLELSSFGNVWATCADFDKKTHVPILFVDPEKNPNTCRFRFMYYSWKGSSLIVTPPSISRLSVKSEPQEFLDVHIVRQIPDPFATTIEIIPRQSFLGSLDEPLPIRLKISFETQFGHEERCFQAYVK